MIGTLLARTVLPAAATVLFGIMAGFFWTFSNTVIPGLIAVDPAGGLATMQQINVAVQNPVFGIFFSGSVLVAAALVLVTVLRREGLRSLAEMAAGAAYLLGVLMVTVTQNVPMNRALATLDPAGPPSGYAAAWLADWAFWNDFRVAASFFSFIILIVTIAFCRASSARHEVRP